MTDERAIEILDPEHREHYESIEPVEEACRIGIKAIKRVKELEAENAELRARLKKAVELPYEVGSTVYIIHETDEEDKINPWIDAGRIVSFSIDVKLWIYVRYNNGLTMWYTKDSFDKEVSITFEAAEARLKEIKEKNND